MIKCLPFTPIECIFTHMLPLTINKYYRRFLDFINEDHEFYD